MPPREVQIVSLKFLSQQEETVLQDFEETVLLNT
jgi:hypothetical protein